MELEQWNALTQEERNQYEAKQHQQLEKGKDREGVDWEVYFYIAFGLVMFPVVLYFMYHIIMFFTVLIQ